MHILRFLVSALLAVLPLRSATADEFSKNEEVRSVLRESGDNTLSPRSIQHFAYFPGAEEQRAFHDFVVSRGYRIDDEHSEAVGRLPWAVIFSKVQAPAEIDEETSILRANAERMKGDYDGWETAVVRE